MSSSPRVSLRVTDKRATVIGGTGLVGEHLVDALVADPAYSRVNVFARSRPPAGLSAKVHWLPMPALDRFAATWPAADAETHMEAAVAAVLPKGDDFFSALGTTRRQAGSLAKFRFVDLGINTAFAKTAARAGYAQYSLVSALGADPKSWVPYSRTKGELELAVSVLPFWAVHLFQPGLLLGARPDARLGENVAAAVLGGLARVGLGRGADYQSIDAEAVARAMVSAAQQTVSQLRRYTRADILELSGEPVS